MPVIRLDGISKRFGKVAAVDDLCLEIEKGEFVSLLGPSGCGKTTTLRCIAGLEPPDNGEIWINEKLVFSSRKLVWVPPRERKLSMVFQTYAVWPHMNVFENIAFGLKAQKVPKREIKDRVHKVLDLVGIRELVNRYPFQLSGGQQQRVALARALVVQPSVLLMDEPLSNLDARLRMLMRDELKRLHRESGTTTVYVTHDQTEALALSTRIVVMKEGRVQQIDGPKELYDYPANLFVAQFVGTLPINLLKLDVVSKDASDMMLRTQDGALELPVPPEQGLALPKTVIGAIRPEDIGVDCRVKSDDRASFRVVGVQFLGSQTIIRVQKGRTELAIEATGELAAAIDVGDPLQPLIDVRKIRFYDLETQALISA